ncbi:MAG: GTPase HflX [Chlamydiae bacterium]|nr:GTPase HflX [Chlamydiota bacterium]
MVKQLDLTMQFIKDDALNTEIQRALLVGVYFNTQEKSTLTAYLDELEALLVNLDIQVVKKMSIPLKKIHRATLIGKGKVEEIANLVAEENIDMVVFDDEILPSQQRNLEKTLKKAIVDRTEVILEVFSRHAQTKEAKLQVELAQSQYQLPRLKRLWTHLSRQVSGGKYLKGTGEKQLEIDKRLIKKRISQLKQEIEKITNVRIIQRQKRQKSNIPTFAIVGYTNSGKSTLLNTLTQADVLAEDRLFATLDTTTRKYTLPNHQEVLLIDTVGFIRKIPTTLVASFKSTLEEAIKAHFLIHVIDVSDPMCLEHAAQTLEVLKELGAHNIPTIHVLNKLDLCKDHSILQQLRLKYPKTAQISALNNEGLDRLNELMEQELRSLRTELFLKIPQKEYGLVCEMIESGQVFSQEYEDHMISLHVEVPNYLAKRLEKYTFS